MADALASCNTCGSMRLGGRRGAEPVCAGKGCFQLLFGHRRAEIGPSVTRSDAVSTLLGLATATWNHAPSMYDVIQVEDVDWPRFEVDEGR